MRERASSMLLAKSTWVHSPFIFYSQLINQPNIGQIKIQHISVAARILKTQDPSIAFQSLLKNTSPVQLLLCFTQEFVGFFVLFCFRISKLNAITIPGSGSCVCFEVCFSFFPPLAKVTGCPPPLLPPLASVFSQVT